MPKHITSEVPSVKSTHQMVDSRQAKYGKKNPQKKNKKKP